MSQNLYNIAGYFETICWKRDGWIHCCVEQTCVCACVRACVRACARARARVCVWWDLWV